MSTVKPNRDDLGPADPDPKRVSSAAGAAWAAQAATDEPSPPLRRPRLWRRIVSRRIALVDLVAVLIATFGTQALWLNDESDVFVREDSALPNFSYTVFSSVLAIGWMLALALANSRDHRIVGGGSDEYKRVFNASLTVFGVVAILAFILRVDIARGYLIISLPVGLVLLVAGRLLLRRLLQSARRRGRAVRRTLVAGTATQVNPIVAEFATNTWAGYRVIGVCVPSADASTRVDGTNVLGDLDSIRAVMDQHDIDTVVVASGDDLDTVGLRTLSWSLDPERHELVVAPGLLDVGGPRIHARPVAGLPLIHVEPVRYTRVQRLLKRTLDLVGSFVGMIVISPLLLALWLIVKLTSPGDAIFTQPRVGLSGNRFTMYKFRTMVSNAEELRAELLEQQPDAPGDAGNRVLFKMKNDPRITPVGRIMRRFSLDELPQLVNVLLGQMSLVGPRPPIESELEKYTEHVHRRFLVKPGITGLWQVSGRSNLSWEDSVRLDLYYVENWSLVGDLVILWRTIRAVFGRDGAY